MTLSTAERLAYLKPVLEKHFESDRPALQLPLGLIGLVPDAKPDDDGWVHINTRQLSRLMTGSVWMPKERMMPPITVVGVTSFNTGEVWFIFMCHGLGIDTQAEDTHHISQFYYLHSLHDPTTPLVLPPP